MDDPIFKPAFEGLLTQYDKNTAEDHSSAMAPKSPSIEHAVTQMKQFGDTENAASLSGVHTKYQPTTGRADKHQSNIYRGK